MKKDLDIFNKLNLHILGVSDYKIIHKDAIAVQKSENCSLIASSAWRNTNNATYGGVGILIDSKTEKALSEIKLLTKRIIMAKLNGNPAITMIVNYAPNKGSDYTVEHYEQLINTVTA